MSHKMTLQWLFVLLIAPAIVQSISVIGPRVLRPFSTYTVSVAGDSRAHSLYVAVEGRRANGEQFSQGRELQVPAATSRIVELEISDPGPGLYSLVARSTSGPAFSSSAPLIYQPRSFCVFVQTDKRVYQPGDTIRFRVVALDKYLLPLGGAVEAAVLDSGGAAVRQWAAAALDRGVLEGELALADDPALGEWTIQVEVRGQTYSRRVLVADYVMPKFQMTMDMPKEILFSDGRFAINVTAKHFNGVPVRGELTISAFAVFFSGLLQPVFSSPARKVIDFNGNAEIIYDLKTDLDLAEDAARPLVVEAVLEEKDTLIRQNMSSRILLLRTSYRLKLSAPERFRPTLPYTVQIELLDSSGQVMDVNEDVSVERLWDDGAPVNVTTVSLKKGFATYSVTPDLAHRNSTLNVVVKYKEVSERVVNVQQGEASGGHYMTVEILSRGTSVGDEMRAVITASEPMDLVHYIIIGRGDILVSETVEVSPPRRSVPVSAAVSGRMSPGAALLAWHSAAGGALLAAAALVPQGGLLQHKVSVTPRAPSTGVYRPGGSVAFAVAASDGALAALLGQDAAAVTAGLAGADGRGSGLDIKTIEREVESFSGLKHSIFKNEDLLPEMGLDLSGFSTADVFRNAGVVILAEGVDSVIIAGEVSKDVPETGTRPPLAGPYAFSRLPAPPSPRFYLTVEPQPTWMVTNVTVGTEEKGIGERWYPAKNEPGIWTVGAFAVHPTLGLGVATPKTFATTVPLIMTAELPETLQKGETVAAVIILKSSLTVDTSVEVTFHNSDQFFEFEPLENDLDASKKIELFRRIRLTVPARGSVGTAFLVTAVRAGEASVIVEATGTGVSASLFRNIDVKDGYEEELWTWGLLDARRSVARANVTLDVRAGSRLGAATLLGSGSLLAGALQGVKPPQLPPPCDPNYAARPMALAAVLLDYLLAEDPDETVVTKRARADVEFGYQRLMAFRKPDGSFATEISDDAEGDVWATSIAIRWVSRAARYVAAPPAAAAAARWLASKQGATGGWDAPPRAERVAPHAERPVVLAAHALVALQQFKGGEALFSNTINKAVDYVSRSLSSSLDAYTLAVCAYALASANHPQASQALHMMDRYANTTGSTLFWSRQVPANEWRNPWLAANSLEAAAAAWGLRALLAAGLEGQAAPVARYVLQAYRPDDQDPELLDALAQYSAATKTSSKLRVTVNVTGLAEPRQFSVDDDNVIIVQPQLVANSRSAFATTEGRGIAVVGLFAKGTTNVTAAWPRYTLDPRVDQVSTKDRLQLSICVGFVAQGNETESGLALLTVQLPSGYLADINALTELTAARHVVSARLSSGGARVLAWLRTARGERCATLAAPRALPVARQRPGWATLRDLYDSSHRARVFFQPIASTACDACRHWASCARACGATGAQIGTGGPAGGTGGSGGAGGSTGKGEPDHAAAISLAPAALLAAIIVTLLQRAI